MFYKQQDPELWIQLLHLSACKLSRSLPMCPSVCLPREGGDLSPGGAVQAWQHLGPPSISS